MLQIRQESADNVSGFGVSEYVRMVRDRLKVAGEKISRDRLVETTCWLLSTMLIVALTACGTGGETETAETQRPGANAEADTSDIRQTYDRIGQHYQQMMGRYQGMVEDMSPEARNLYERMRERYGEMMAQEGMGHGMMEPSMMGQHMMAMHSRTEWSREMLELHRRMAEVHGAGGYSEMAQMHEQMTELYQDVLRDSASQSNPQAGDSL